LEAARGRGIGCVAAGGFLQHGSEGFGHGPVRLQYVVQGNGPGAGPVIENAAVKTGLVAERCVEARRVDAERLGNVGDADRIVAARMEKMLGSGERLLRIEAPGPTSPFRIICSTHYKNP
jgi:hypothetical protein